MWLIKKNVVSSYYVSCNISSRMILKVWGDKRIDQDFWQILDSILICTCWEIELLFSQWINLFISELYVYIFYSFILFYERELYVYIFYNLFCVCFALHSVRCLLFFWLVIFVGNIYDIYAKYIYSWFGVIRPNIIMRSIDITMQPPKFLEIKILRLVQFSHGI